MSIASKLIGSMNEGSNMDDVFKELVDKYKEKEFGDAVFWVSKDASKNLINVSFDITFRRNTRTGYVKQNKAKVDKANDILSSLNNQYKNSKNKLKLVTLADAQASDDRAENNGDSAYSEYEQSLGGSLEIHF